MKVVIIGSFDTNSTYAYSLINHNIHIDELVFIQESQENMNEIFLNTGASFFESNLRIRNGNYNSSNGASIIVVTGNQTIETIKEIVKNAKENNFDGIYMLATDDVNVDCYLFYKIANVPTHKVIGIGTMLQTSYLNYIISDRLNLDSNCINAYVCGDSKDYTIPWNTCNIGVLCIYDCFTEESLISIEQELKKKFIDNSYIKANALAYLTNVIVNNKRQILTVSSYDVETGVYISIPSIVDKCGVRESITLDLTDNDNNKINATIKHIKEKIDSINI